MVVLHAISELNSLPGPLVLAVGVFDGVHLGHQAVLLRAQNEALLHRGTAVAVTFANHPAKVVRPEHAPLQLTLTPHKTRLLAALGFTHTLLLTFDSELAATEPADFIRSLCSAACSLASICVGSDWAFGQGRKGNLSLLRELGEKLQFEAIGVAPVVHQGHPVSSTRVRTAVREGDLDCAHTLLGRPFTVLGEVIPGRRLGRTLGFPTANLALFNEQLPPAGVYAVRADWNGVPLRGVANLGVRPTVEGECSKNASPSLEIHFFSLDADLYHQVLEVEFVRFLRAEKHFPSLEALRLQIQDDAESAMQTLSERSPHTRGKG
ncbi:MAG: hypothetical protein RLZZ399_427 [Verrucomicrobiota bacterium]|jgi:riboflavin kinase/FMN adenylyltransferase